MQWIYFVGNTYNLVYIWCCKYGENRYCERCANKKSKHTGLLLNTCWGKLCLHPYLVVPLISARVTIISTRVSAHCQAILFWVQFLLTHFIVEFESMDFIQWKNTHTNLFEHMAINPLILKCKILNRPHPIFHPVSVIFNPWMAANTLVHTQHLRPRARPSVSTALNKYSLYWTSLIQIFDIYRKQH